MRVISSISEGCSGTTSSEHHRLRNLRRRNAQFVLILPRQHRDEDLLSGYFSHRYSSGRMNPCPPNRRRHQFKVNELVHTIIIAKGTSNSALQV
jgi:hypothetical protein